MDHQLSKIRKQFTILVVASFLITPVCGLWGAVFFGLSDWSSLQHVLLQGLLPMFLCLMLLWVGFHFWEFIGIAYQRSQDSAGDRASRAQQLHAIIRRFGYHYWSLLAGYALITPVIYMVSDVALSMPQDLRSYFMFSLLQITISILIALPAYLFISDNLGQLASVMGIKQIHNSLKSKILLLGGFVPLLSYSLLLEFYWLNTGALTPQVLAIWGVLCVVTLAVAMLARLGIDYSLRPVLRILNQSGAITNDDLACMSPKSTDEIGYLVQTLGRVFTRLVDQESQMHAVVSNAAEGIVVTDDEGNIDTFNLAAEKLFGYSAAEVRGRPVSKLMPLLTDHKGLPHIPAAGQELQAMHSKGYSLVVTVRASNICLSGRSMFVYLVDDVTEKKIADEGRRKAETRYRDLVETAHDLVWSMDTNGAWSYLNSASIHIYDYAPHEMIGHSVSEFMAPEYAEQEKVAFAELLEGEELHQFETAHIGRHGEMIHLSFNAKAQRDHDGKVIQISGTARDITEKKAYEQKLTYQAEHDALTGLYNRRYFQRELERVVARVTRSAATCAILYLDLDQFKYINDTMGHAAGDRLLVEISNQLLAHVREGELLARFGGDEFTVLLYNIDEDHLYNVAENFRHVFESYRFVDGDKSFAVSCSIGAAIIDNHSHTAEEAMSHADLACNIAKSQGRNCVYIYTPEQQDMNGMEEDMGWAARVRDMLENDSLLLVYQPIVDTMSKTIHSYEILMRMLLDDGQVILPGGFMPAAERFGLVHDIDRWMVRHAIDRMAELQTQGVTARFSVNLSGHAFEDKGLLPLIEETISSRSVNPECITFEIAETAVITKMSNAQTFIDAIRNMGCSFALDDFGSGFCSFTHLKNIDADLLKIDSSLIRNIVHSAEDLAMVKSINEIAHVMGKKTVAESVENGHTCDMLQALGVDYVQGHYLGRPLENISVDQQRVQCVDGNVATSN